MLPIGSIWEWTTDGSIGVVVSKVRDAQVIYGRVPAQLIFFLNDDDSSYMEMSAEILDRFVRNETIRRLDSED